MKKLLFLDYRELEYADGFARAVESPVKDAGAPLLRPELPWEHGNMQMFGSVLQGADGRFRAWYEVVEAPWRVRLAYAESEDGLRWQKPDLDVFRDGGRATNIVFDGEPLGSAVIEDRQDPRPEYRFKLLTGAAPSGCVSAFHSADGMHWESARMFGGRVQPVIATAPDCPIGFLRAPDGRFAAYHRMAGYGRRVFRSESWDFAHWSGEPQMVLEPDAGDPPQTQFYGLGAGAYGSYELGTLWIYATDPEDRESGKPHGLQTPELTYARVGTAWHRAEPGTAFIPNGAAGEWDCGNLQAASQPVFLDDEIRYYYAGTNVRHSRHWELEPQEAGLGMARLKPDRFVALRAGEAPAELGTIAFKPPSVDVFVNARTADDGEVRVELQDAEARPLAGFTAGDCRPINGDSTAHRVEWRGVGQAEAPVGQPTRIRVTARGASVYSVFVTEPGESPVYHQFEALRPDSQAM
ncbi:MAG: hypothetical protein OXG65_15375 [Chloroflexi bacterium]|nr:hypothetical protein [Chloroflexota bacterium]